MKTCLELVKYNVAEGAGNTYSATNHPSGFSKGVAAMQSNDEQWRPVPGFDGSYEVSDQGKVRSLDRIVYRKDGTQQQSRGRVLTLRYTRNGYAYVNLGRGFKQTVHRLVLDAFVGTCPDGMEACHANDIKADNRLVNLRWDTRSSNRHDAVKNGIHPMSKKTHCKWGHEYTPDNTGGGRPARPFRYCRRCEIDRRDAKNAKRRAERAAARVERSA